MRFGVTASAWQKQASLNFNANPVHPKPMRRRHMTVYTFPWTLHALSPQSERFTTSLARNLAPAILEEIDEAERTV